MDKKAISPVVAVALLLVLTVSAVVGFQTWFQSYSSGIFAEAESQDLSSNSGVEDIVGEELFFKNDDDENITINKIKVGDSECSINSNVSKGIQSINLGSCIDNHKGNTEVVIYTDDKIFSKKFFIDGESSISESSFSLDCSSLPGEWSKVPGNNELGTEDFCVMTYEAKATTASESNLYDPTNMYCGDGSLGGGNGCSTDGSVNVTSKAESLPLTEIYQTQARTLCSNLGSGYQLITDSQWVTMARNAENIGSNWDSGIVGQGSMWRGHSDNSPSNSLSVSNTSDFYDQTGNSNPSNQRRVLELSTGDIVWDIGGNVFSWTNDTFTSNTQSSLGQSSSGWYEWTEITGHNYLEPFNSTFDSTFGVGEVHVDVDNAWPTSTTHAFRRGGDWNDGDSTGSFTLRLSDSPKFSYASIGLRCSYTG